MLERNSKLMNKKLVQYLLPSMLMIFAMQFGSLFDGIFVGNFIGNDALTASSLVVPILYVIQLPGIAIGVGGSIVVANLLGKREISKSKTVFSICMILGMAISLVFTILSFFVSEPLARLFCPEEYVELARQYVFVYLVSDPAIVFALLIASFIGVDNNPRIASGIYIAANVFKVASEFIFINYGGLGMYGAALSTGFGYFMGALLMIFYIFSKKRMLSFTLKFDSPKTALVDSLKASGPSAANLFLTALQMSICNIFISRLIDPNSIDILVFGVIANMVFVFDLFSGGIIQTIPNICGVLYGEKDYFALKKITHKIFIINIAVTAILVALLASLPGVYCQIFGFDATGSEDLTYKCIWIYLVSFIPYEISKFNQMHYPTIEKNIPSYVTILCREVILVLPLTIVLLHTHGLVGYCIAQTANEVGTVIITYIFIIIYNKVKKNKDMGLLLIPNIRTNDKYDVTITNDIHEVSILSSEIRDYALKHNASERNATVIALGAEEMVSNIIQYGYKIKNHHYYIDVSLRVLDDKIILIIKDDGVIFDPTQYQEEEQEFSTSGILLVRKLVSNITYTRVLSINNTYIEIYLQGAC